MRNKSDKNQLLCLFFNTPRLVLVNGVWKNGLGKMLSEKRKMNDEF